MVKFACSKCKYRFSPRTPSHTKPPAICPYCSREGTVFTEKSAEDIIKDVDDMIGD